MANANGARDDDRTWRLLLRTGAVFGFLLLGWQVADYVSDGTRPAMQKNDLVSAAASIGMLAIVGIISARRAQMLRQAAAAVPAPRIRQKKAKKRAPVVTRRKRRA